MPNSSVSGSTEQRNCTLISSVVGLGPEATFCLLSQSDKTGSLPLDRCSSPSFLRSFTRGVGQHPSLSLVHRYLYLNK